MASQDELDDIREKRRQELIDAASGGGVETSPDEQIHIDGKACLDEFVAKHGVD